ncbi:MAG: hypothetical protein AB1758_29745 [Candidatus Eremiobacterota bacterium]
MLPSLGSWVKKHPEYALIVVNIDNWDSPVARQFNLHSIPAFAFYDANGNLQAQGEAAKSRMVNILENSGDFQP